MDTDALLRDNSAFSAWWHLARAYNSLASGCTRFFEQHGVTGAQFGVLRCVADAGDEGLMLSDLSRRLMVTCGNITGVVDRLEQAGLLRRERNPDDRRVVIARLTPEGRALYERVMPDYQSFLRCALGDLSPEEHHAMGEACEKLFRSLEQRRAVFAGSPVPEGDPVCEIAPGCEPGPGSGLAGSRIDRGQE